VDVVKPVIDKPLVDRDVLIDGVHCEAAKLGFTSAIEKSDYGSYIRKQFFVLGCKRDDVYKPTNKKLKFEDTLTRGNVDVR
jgi:hypothetical protein